MSPHVIRQLQNAVPFQPYVIHTVDGRAFRIPSREFVSMNESGRTIFVWEKQDRFNFLDSILVSRVELGPSSPETTSNGAAPPQEA